MQEPHFTDLCAARSMLQLSEGMHNEDAVLMWSSLLVVESYTCSLRDRQKRHPEIHNTSEDECLSFEVCLLQHNDLRLQDKY